MKELNNELADAIGQTVAPIVILVVIGAFAAGFIIGIHSVVKLLRGDPDEVEDRMADAARLRSGERAWWEVMIGLGDHWRYHGGWVLVGFKWMILGGVVVYMLRRTGLIRD